MNDYVELACGKVRMWIDNGVVMLKAVDDPYPDPVELDAEQAREIAQALLRLADVAGD